MRRVSLIPRVRSSFLPYPLFCSFCFFSFANVRYSREASKQASIRGGLYGSRVYVPASRLTFSLLVSLQVILTIRENRVAFPVPAAPAVLPRFRELHTSSRGGATTPVAHACVQGCLGGGGGGATGYEYRNAMDQSA